MNFEEGTDQDQLMSASFLIIDERESLEQSRSRKIKVLIYYTNNSKREQSFSCGILVNAPKIDKILNAVQTNVNVARNWEAGSTHPIET